VFWCYTAGVHGEGNMCVGYEVGVVMFLYVCELAVKKKVCVCVFCGMAVSEKGEFWCENEKGKELVQCVFQVERGKCACVLCLKYVYMCV
jgi:hypothetical protein